jgi:positive regulator of sigma E activity
MLIQIKGSFNNPGRYQAHLFIILRTDFKTACSKCAGRHGCFKSCISVSDVHRGGLFPNASLRFASELTEV